MNITNTGIAVALAVAIGLAFLLFGPMVFLPFENTNANPMTASDTGAAALGGAAAPGAPVTTASGLQITDITVGTGAEAMAGDTVSVEYVGALTDGTIFDSSQAHGQAFTFTLGTHSVISGWEEGIAGMKEGGQRILQIPPSLGYGAQAVGPIPANSTLIFQVQLDKVQKGQ